MHLEVAYVEMEGRSTFYWENLGNSIRERGESACSQKSEDNTCDKFKLEPCSGVSCTQQDLSYQLQLQHMELLHRPILNADLLMMELETSK